MFRQISDWLHEAIAAASVRFDTDPGILTSALGFIAASLAWIVCRRAYRHIRGLDIPALSEIADTILKLLAIPDDWTMTAHGSLRHSGTAEPCDLSCGSWRGFTVRASRKDLTDRLSRRELKLIWARAQEIIQHKTRERERAEHHDILVGLQPVTVVEIGTSPPPMTVGEMRSIIQEQAEAVAEAHAEEARKHCGSIPPYHKPEEKPARVGGLGRVPVPTANASRK